MSETMQFNTLDVAGAYTGVLLNRDGIGGIYDVLGYVLGDRGLMTHQLPGAASAAEGALERQHPWLAQLDPPTGDRIAGLGEWCDQLIAAHGATVPVAPASDPDWRGGRALDDLVEMVGRDRVIPVHLDHSA